MLKQDEAVRLDAARLAELYEQLGESGAENVVCRALEELALRLTQAERSYAGAEWRELRRGVRSLIAIADQMGMRMLTRVAADVVACLDSGDRVGLAATLSRLMRVGERSLTEVWEGCEPPI
jgi:hypothetical protein